LVSKYAGNFLTSLETISFATGTLIHVLSLVSHLQVEVKLENFMSTGRVHRDRKVSDPILINQSAQEELSYNIAW